MSDDYGEVNGDTLTTDSGTITIDTPNYTIDPKYWHWVDQSGKVEIQNNKKGDDENMRYLYEVILVNPKNDNFVVKHIIAKTEISAMMQAYDENDFSDVNIKFDDLRTSCRVLMEWKKKESLKKAIETIKKAVE